MTPFSICFYQTRYWNTACAFAFSENESRFQEVKRAYIREFYESTGLTEANFLRPLAKLCVQDARLKKSMDTDADAGGSAIALSGLCPGKLKTAWSNLHHSLGKFCRWQIDDTFSLSLPPPPPPPPPPQNIGLDITCKLLHEIWKPIFWGKKNSNCHLKIGWHLMQVVS